MAQYSGNPARDQMAWPFPAAYNRETSHAFPNNQNFNPNVYANNTYLYMQATSQVTPVPPAYTRQLSYSLSKPQYHDPNVYVEDYGSSVSLQSPGTEVDSLDKTSKDEKAEFLVGKRKKSMLLFLRDWRFYIRILAVLVMIVSISLVLTAVISFAKAQKKAGNPLANVPKPATITDHPCVVFSGVAVMNLMISIATLCVSFMSPKFRKSNAALNATFIIVSAVGFATSMGACSFINKQTTLQNDLWRWSCGNHKKGIVSDAIDFNLICNVVSYGWKFGLVQASLELLTFIISIVAFVLLKYSYFARYGRLGKVF